MVTHRGRITGRLHRTVLEVTDHDPTVPEWTVVSGYGTTSDWYRNLRTTPALRIDVDGRHFAPSQRFLDENERRQLLEDYQHRRPRTAQQLGERLLGTTFDGSDDAITALAQHCPAVAFRPSAAATTHEHD